MPVAALKPTPASSGTKGVKRSAPTGEEPTSKRARVGSVTRVFAADNNKSQLGQSRKRERNKNAMMRDLLAQSRKTMFPLHAITSNGSSARRTGPISSKAFALHSSRTPTDLSDVVTDMDIDSGEMVPLMALNPSAPMPSPSTSQRLTLTRKLGSAGASNAGILREDFISGAATPSGAARRSARVPFSKPSFQNPRPTHSTHMPLHLNSHEPTSDPAQPESTLADIDSEPGFIVAAVTDRSSTRYGTLANRNLPRNAGRSLNGISIAPRHGGKKIQKPHGFGSDMPSWLIETLSTLPSRYPLSIPQAVTSTTYSNDLDETSGESPLSSFHASTSSLEYAKRKAAHSNNGLHQNRHSLAATKPPTTPERSTNVDFTSFAFAPPPISPRQDPQTTVTRPETDRHDFATSTPPWRAKLYSSIHPQQVDQIKDRASGCIESSLFDTSISPIILSAQINPLNRPNTPHSHFTASPPDTAFTLGSNISAERHPIVPSHNLVEDVASMDQTQHAGLFEPLSSVDPFGATWAALQSSRSEIAPPIIRPFNQRRFFFTSSHQNKLNARPAPYFSNNPTLFKSATLQLSSDSSASHISQHTWSPSFPEAKLPNHRHALPPPKSQLRNSFLGAANPLVTAAAIEAATAAADQNPACLDVSDALNAANASIHVRFRTPTRSPALSFSENGSSRLLDCFEDAQLSQFGHPSDFIGDEHALTGERCFFYDEAPTTEHMELTEDRSRSQFRTASDYPLTRTCFGTVREGLTDILWQNNCQDGNALRFVQIGDDAAFLESVIDPVRQDATSVDGKDLKSRIGLAGIGSDDELLRLLESDAGEEVEMGDIGQSNYVAGEGSQEPQYAPPIDELQDDDSHDSIGSWGDDDV